MQEPVCYENYPVSIVIASNLLSLLMYVIGVYLVYQLWQVLVIPYLLFILLLEYRLLSKHCVDCYYYGKTCAFGKGKLSGKIFPKGSPERFCSMKVTWKDILPDFLVFLIPVIAGIVILPGTFSVVILALVIILLVLGFAGNALVRGRLACRYCKQKETGCPALAMFEKKA
ncbi:MAG: hypothetical protein A4E35_00769 [Methanoregula sp. PtaU1.Bin051]|nr:MAG: hypothetical protein A4E35_00769 [Methanoregula sp. PtaU1.Bin051]